VEIAINGYATLLVIAFFASNYGRDFEYEKENRRLFESNQWRYDTHRIAIESLPAIVNMRILMLLTVT